MVFIQRYSAGYEKPYADSYADGYVEGYLDAMKEVIISLKELFLQIYLPGDIRFVLKMSFK